MLEVANAAYLRGFLCSALPSDATYCVLGGVNITILSAFDRGLPKPVLRPSSQGRQQPQPYPPQSLASPSDASPASCKGSGKRPATVLGRLVSPYWTVEIVRIVLRPRIVRLLGTATRSRCEDGPPGLDSLEVRHAFAGGRTLPEGAKGRRGKLYGDR